LLTANKKMFYVQNKVFAPYNPHLAEKKAIWDLELKYCQTTMHAMIFFI